MKDQDMRSRMDMRGRDEVGCWNRHNGPRTFRKVMGIWKPKNSPDHSKRAGK